MTTGATPSRPVKPGRPLELTVRGVVDRRVHPAGGEVEPVRTSAVTHFPRPLRSDPVTTVALSGRTS